MLTNEEDYLFEIEKGVPLPPKKIGSQGRRTLYPDLDRMGVGDSIVYPKELKLNMRGAIMHRQMRYGKRFMQRKQEDGSIRLWRIG